MDKPCTAQQLIDWIRDYLEQLEDKMIGFDGDCFNEEPKVILEACKAYLEERHGTERVEADVGAGGDGVSGESV